MRVFVLLHGMPPIPGQPVVGTGLRAFANGEGLRRAGHEVFYCTRAEDLPGAMKENALALRGPAKTKARITRLSQAEGDRVARPADVANSGLAPAGGPLGSPGNPLFFTDADELAEAVEAVKPEIVLLEAPEEAERLPEGDFSVVVDLFAPRILEQQFQTAKDDRETARALNALRRGDFFLFSNPRQRYYFLPLLALAGVDCTQKVGAVIPISCPPGIPPIKKPKAPVFVAGGVFWPWADLSLGLKQLLAALDEAKTGSIHLYGGEYGIRSDTVTYSDPRAALPKKHSRLKFKGMVPIDELWKNYAKASVAFDLMAPNPERDLNLSFRQIDYLRCGLPIITAPGQVISDALLKAGAGWCLEPGDAKGLRKLCQELLAAPELVKKASAAAQQLARTHFVWTQTTAPLVAFAKRPIRRQHDATVLSKMAELQGRLWGEHEQNQRLQDRIAHLDEDIGKKTEEIQSLNTQIGVLMGSVDRLSGSISEVSRFKNDTLKYLHEAQDEALREAGELSAELERRALDLEKKDGALKKAQREVTKLKSSIKQLKRENQSLETKFAGRDAESLELENERKALEDRLRGSEEDLRRLRRDIAKKNREMENTAEELEKQRSRAELSQESGEKERIRLRDLRQKLSETEELLRTQTRDLEDQRDKAEELDDRLRAGEYRQEELRRELRKKERELEDAQISATNTHVEMDASISALTDRLQRIEFESRTFLKELQKKENEIRDMKRHRDSLRDEMAGKVSQFSADLESKDEEVKSLRLQLEDRNSTLDGIRKDNIKKSREIEEAHASRDEAIETLRRLTSQEK